MSRFTLFKIEYDWYEEEHEETLIGKEVSAEEFEKDIAEAKKFAEKLKGTEVNGDYLGKGYSVECLPEFYEQILWFLTNKKGYVYCDYDDDVLYDIDDASDKKISITRSEKKIERVELS